MRSPLLAVVLGVIAGACTGGATTPTDFGPGLDLSGQWHLADSTLYDITNADALRHVGSYVVSGTATMVRGGVGSYAAQLDVHVVSTDSVVGQPARHTTQDLVSVSAVVVLNDSIFGLSAGGEVVPPAAHPTDLLVAWSYGQTEGECLNRIAGFQPRSVSCRQSVRWSR